MKEKTLAYLLLLATLVAVGCGPSSSGATETPVEPTLAPLEQPTSDQPSDALLQDAQAYAADVGVDLEEALNRLGLQDAIGNLNARLQSEQRDTFAGLWVEHQPAPGTVAHTYLLRHQHPGEPGRALCHRPGRL